MAEMIKPGVYVYEYDKSQFITEGPTTLTGIVGEAKKGPANEIVFLSSYEDYTNTFGQDSGYLDFFSRFFFKYGGNKLYAVRVTDEYRFAGLSLSPKSTYSLYDTLAPTDVQIQLETSDYEGLEFSDWPSAGLVKLVYNNKDEYINYREKSTLGGYFLKGCVRGVNGTDAIDVPVWETNCAVLTGDNKIVPAGIICEPNTALHTDEFYAPAHGLADDTIIQFSGTGGGVTAYTNYYVINAVNDYFQIATSIGGTAIVLTGTTKNIAKDTASLSHGRRNGDIIQFVNTLSGITMNTNYYVVNKTTNDFKISLTLGGAAISITSTDDNIYNKMPIPTKTIKLISTLPTTTINAINNIDKTITYDEDSVDYGIMPENGGKIIVKTSTLDGVVLDYLSIDKTDLSNCVIQFASTVDLSVLTVSDVFTLCLDPYYGGFSDATLAKYQEYDAWNQPSYDEEGNIVDAAGVTDPQTSDIFMNIYATSCGMWANTEFKLSIYNYNDWNATPRPYYFNKTEIFPKSADELLIIIEDNLTGQIAETFLVSLLMDKKDYWGKTMYINDVINENSKYIRLFINSDYVNQYDVLPNSMELVYLDGGTDGNGQPVREYKIMGAYNLFANKNKIDIDILSAGGNQSFAVQQNIIAICNSRKDCVGILNIPEGMDVSKAIRYKQLLQDSTYYGIYYNGFEYLDPFTGSIVLLPPAIQTTSIIVKSDLISDPWYAAAGYNRGTLNEVLKLEHAISDGDFDMLYLNSINPIINEGFGSVVMGIKTGTSLTSSFSYLPIRRLFIKMEKDIKKSLRSFVFEPNTQETRLRVMRTIEPYLESIKSRNGIEDYRVICDSKNNTNTTQALGQLIVDIYIKPTFTIQYIKLNFIATKDDISAIIS